MENLKIRDMKDKTEIDGFIYCLGEDEPFTGIFIEKVKNTLERCEIREAYDEGIIVRREEYNKFNTRKNGYKMFLVKLMIYDNGKLCNKAIFQYDKYGELKKEIIPNISEKVYKNGVLKEEVLFNENIVKYYTNRGNIIKSGNIESYKLMSFLKKVSPIIALIFVFIILPVMLSDNSDFKNYNTKDDTYYMKELEREVNRQLNDPEIRRQLEEEVNREIEEAKREMNL